MELRDSGKRRAAAKASWESFRRQEVDSPELRRAAVSFHRADLTRLQALSCFIDHLFQARHCGLILLLSAKFQDGTSSPLTRGKQTLRGGSLNVSGLEGGGAETGLRICPDPSPEDMLSHSHLSAGLGSARIFPTRAILEN